MRIIDPGHIYALRWLDLSEDESAPSEGLLKFVKRKGPDYPGNIDSFSGTTTQEVLRALIDRTKYVNNQIPNHHNNLIIRYLRIAILELELRAAERHGRVLPNYDLNFIETIETCPKCNHIGCQGDCHG